MIPVSGAKSTSLLDKPKIGKKPDWVSFAFLLHFFLFSIFFFLYLFGQIHLLEQTLFSFFLLFISLTFFFLSFLPPVSSILLLFFYYSPLPRGSRTYRSHLPFLAFLLPFLFCFFWCSSSPLLLQPKIERYNSVFLRFISFFFSSSSFSFFLSSFLLYSS